MANITKHNFKICMIGEGGVGKTTFIKRHRTGKFEQKYVATLGVEVYPLRFRVKGEKGEVDVCLNMWDCAGQEKFGGLRDGYYIQSHGCIVMCDLASKLTYTRMEWWLKEFNRVCKSAPVIIVGNKASIRITKVSTNQVHEFAKNAESFNVKGSCVVSAKKNFNFEKPFLLLIRELLGDDTLSFVDLPKIDVPNIEMSKERIAMLLCEAEEAAAYPLPF